MKVMMSLIISRHYCRDQFKDNHMMMYRRTFFDRLIAELSRRHWTVAQFDVTADAVVVQARFRSANL